MLKRWRFDSLQLLSHDCWDACLLLPLALRPGLMVTFNLSTSAINRILAPGQTMCFKGVPFGYSNWHLLKL
jgi:hypothetical protein